MDKNNKTGDFLAMISRMRYINRWGLMRNTKSESLSEHCFDVAIIAHSLAVIGNKKFGKNYDYGKIALISLYHDCSEILTGDLPTPVKYYNDEIRLSYKNVEKEATNRLFNLIEEEFQSEYKDYLIYQETDSQLVNLVKFADRISALIKCIEEEKSGNNEFFKAKESQMNLIRNSDCDEAKYFLKKYIDSYYKPIDNLI